MLKRGKTVLLTILLAWICFIGFKTFSWVPVPMGESDDYMFTTISLQYEHNLGLQETDLFYAEQDFPEFAEYLRICFGRGEQSSIVDPETGRLPWYFGTYSALCIPAKIILEILEIPQIFSFALTNYILYVETILFALIAMKGSFYERYVAALLLAVNPVVFYIVWQSSEVFMFAMVATSLICWKNKNYYLAGLFVSIAGTMNATVMILGVFIILDYFCEIFKEFQGVQIFFEKKLRSTILLALCFAPCLVPFLYYKLKYGCWNLQVSYGFASGEGQYWGRFLSYLFDWNYGTFPYFPLLFIAFIVLGILSLLKRKYRNLFYWGAFLGVIAAYSIMWHINCGMSGISRYAVWSAPIMVLGTIFMYQTVEFSRPQIKTVVSIGTVVGTALFSVVQLNVYGIMFASNTSDIRLTPVAEFVLQKMPGLYIELESSFIDRVAHIPGGYSYTEPVYYYNDERIVTKLLLQEGDEEKVLEDLVMSDDVRQLVKKQMNNKTGLYYVTIPSKYSAKISNNIILDQYSYINNGEIALSALSTSGKYDEVSQCITINKGEIQFGPYIDLYKGNYRVSITGTNLMQSITNITAQNGAVNLSSSMIFERILDNEIVYSFDLQNDVSRFEIITLNASENDAPIQIHAVTLICIE